MIYLSILIPSIPERFETLAKLIAKIESQLANIGNEHEVEILSLVDNKRMTIGEKRERLKNMAVGKYFAFVDDDDDISDDYIVELLPVCMDEVVDVICFDSWVEIRTEKGVQSGQVNASINNLENNQFIPDKITYRKPSHVNAWLTEKFKEFKFSDSMYGEDFDFCNQCYPHITSGYRIDKILHFYTYDKDVTQAFEK